MAKLTVKFPERTSKILEELSDNDEVSKTEVLRRALALYKYIDDETRKAKGRKVAITDEEDKVIKEILIAK